MKKTVSCRSSRHDPKKGTAEGGFWTCEGIPTQSINQTNQTNQQQSAAQPAAQASPKTQNRNEPCNPHPHPHPGGHTAHTSTVPHCLPPKEVPLVHYVLVLKGCLCALPPPVTVRLQHAASALTAPVPWASPSGPGPFHASTPSTL